MNNFKRSVLSKIKNINIFKFIIFLIIISVVIFCTIKYGDAIKNIKPKIIVKYIRDMKPFSEIIYLMIFVVKPFFVFIPANVVFIMGSMVFGPLEGSILSIIGLWISGTIAFYLAKFLGKDFVHKILGKKLIKIDNKLGEDGFRVLFMLRLPPVLPYDPLSYACGFTEIKYSHFIAASVLGVAPETICYSILGKNFKTPFTLEFMIPICILIVGTICSKPVMDRIKNRNHTK